MQNALAGTLEEEGAANVFMSELGWATYLDKKGKQSYAMNQRVSEAEDGYFTPDIFSNPKDVVGSWAESIKRVVGDPLSSAFPTISNDVDGKRTYGKGSEYKSRTIQTNKVYPPSGDNLFNLFGMPPPDSQKGNKKVNTKLRTKNLPGINTFGAPSSKQLPFTNPFKRD